jgi:hypothetical protein
MGSGCTGSKHDYTVESRWKSDKKIKRLDEQTGSSKESFGRLLKDYFDAR